MKSALEITVRVLDLTPIHDAIKQNLVNDGLLSETNRLRPGWTLGYIEKNGLHYLINHEGIGSSKPLEKGVSVDLYRERTDETGEVVAFAMCSVEDVILFFDDVRELTKLELTLDSFVSKSGRRNRRLESNMQEWVDFMNG